MKGKKPHLLHVFSTFGVGGPEVRTSHIINNLGLKYKHTILAMDSNYDCRERLKKNLDINFLRLNFNKKNTIRNAFLFRKTIKKINPDLLLTYNWGAIEWSIANYFFPIVKHIHLESGFGPDEIFSQNKRRVLLRRIFLRKCFKVIVPSSNLKDIATNIWKLDSDKIKHIPNGVSIPKFIKKTKYPGNIVKVGTVTLLRKEKNIMKMIRIFSHLQKDINAKLLIVGDGPEYKRLENYIKRNNLEKKVFLLGYKKDPFEFLNKIDIFCITSDTEQMPNSVLEAMAVGCPIISTDVGDIRHMVGKRNKQYVIDKTNENKFENLLKELISNKKLREELGLENRKRCINDYNLGNMVDKYKELYSVKIS